jgi:hypothetical protein
MPAMTDHAASVLSPSRPLPKINRPTGEICALFPLSDAARTLLDPGIMPGEYIDRLCHAALHVDAIRFLAHALPLRESVWWACLAARAALLPGDAAAQAAIEAAEAWVYHPDEDHRRVAMAAAEAVANNSPARWAATAAAWTGGSLAPPEAPVVPPGATLTAQAAAGAVLLAAVQSEPERAQDRHRIAVLQALDIAQGGSGRVAGGGT